jgi:hypothetical protein
MSSIAPIDAASEYAPRPSERRQEEPAPEAKRTESTMPDERILTPAVRAAAESQDQKTTIQGFQYTGKGAFIDRVF